MTYVDCMLTTSYKNTIEVNDYIVSVQGQCFLIYHTTDVTKTAEDNWLIMKHFRGS